MPLGFDLNRFRENQEEKRKSFRSEWGVQDDEVFMESEIDYGGKVTLIGDGRTINFDDASKNEDLWWEIESEIKAVMEESHANEGQKTL